MQFRAGKIVQWVGALATKTVYLSLISETHMMEGEMRLQKLSSAFCTHTHHHTPLPEAHINKCK